MLILNSGACFGKVCSLPTNRLRKLTCCVNRGVKFLNNELPWSQWDLFKATSGIFCVHLPLSYCSVQLFASAVGQDVGHLSYDQISGIGLLQGIMQIVGLILLKDRIKSPSWFCRFDVSIEDIMRGLITGAVATCIVMLLTTVFSLDGDQVTTIGERILIQNESELSFYFEVISAVLISPILEESIYRGIFLTSLTQSCGLPRSIFISSLLFAGFHFSLKAFPELMITGAMFGLGFALSEGNLLVPIIAHSLVNATAIFLIVK